VGTSIHLRCLLSIAVEGGWHTFLNSLDVTATEGAPSLRSLEGPVAYSLGVPALCKVRKGLGTHGFVIEARSKAWATRRETQFLHGFQTGRTSVTSCGCVWTLIFRLLLVSLLVWKLFVTHSVYFCANSVMPYDRPCGGDEAFSVTVAEVAKFVKDRPAENTSHVLCFI
jgi:hypothetical protein